MCLAKNSKKIKIIEMYIDQIELFWFVVDWKQLKKEIIQIRCCTISFICWWWISKIADVQKKRRTSYQVEINWKIIMGEMCMIFYEIIVVEMKIRKKMKKMLFCFGCCLVVNYFRFKNIQYFCLVLIELYLKLCWDDFDKLVFLP